MSRMLKIASATSAILAATAPASAHEGHGAVAGHLHQLSDAAGVLLSAALPVAIVALAVYAIWQLARSGSGN